MKAAPYLAGFALAGVSGVAGMIAQPAMKTSANLEGLDAHETHASASLLGQFRTNTSAWLWLRTDLYLHNGVEMRPLTDAERKLGKKGVGNGEAGEDALHDDSSIVTTVPAKEHDFRGIFGDVDRAVNAYQDMTGHTHNDPNRALPLFRLMTWIDPQFIPGWTVGATVMARNKGKGIDQGIELLQEGLRHNPKSVTLLGELGRFYAAKKGDLDTALRYLHRAVDAAIDLNNLSEVERDGFREAFRWTCLVHQEKAEIVLMRAVAHRGLQLFPDDPVLQRAEAMPPAFLTEKGEREWLEQTESGQGSHDHHGHSH